MKPMKLLRPLDQYAFMSIVVILLPFFVPFTDLQRYQFNHSYHKFAKWNIPTWIRQMRFNFALIKMIVESATNGMNASSHQHNISVT